MHPSSNSQFGNQKGCGVCLARMSAAGADFCSSAIAELHGCNECRKCRSIFLSCIALLHAILGVMQNLHSHHPWRLAAAKPPWMGLRRSSTGIPHTLKSAKLLKLGIAGKTRRLYST
ncbi:hypothetical protein EQU24_19090 [Methylotuvimicrobium buryatense]|uniref:Uncharacterized protein n=1 Tax=Methylotuvimicrobium buryatense TaxID=95641 RepID=A0A4P9UTJ2_METBY|nr:hypothetical protein EQU24_19090 [Methylotuvimicrobium buryatense]